MPMREPLRRRTLITGMLAASSALALPIASLRAEDRPLPLSGQPIPISVAEREARIECARRLMRAQGIDALLIEPGASLIYFTGVEWHRSERLTAAVLPARGEIAIVTPFFEAPSVRETLAVPAEIRVWEEDENPLGQIAAVLKNRGVAAGSIAIEETVRYFAVDGLMKALPHTRIVSVPPSYAAAGCSSRLRKSP